MNKNRSQSIKANKKTMKVIEGCRVYGDFNNNLLQKSIESPRSLAGQDRRDH